MAPSFATSTNTPLPESFPDLPSDSKVSYRTSGDETYVDSSDGLDSEGGGEKDHDNGDNQDDNAEHVSAESHAIIPHQEISSNLNMHHSTITTPPSVNITHSMTWQHVVFSLKREESPPVTLGFGDAATLICSQIPFPRYPFMLPARPN